MTKEDLVERVNVLELYLESGDESILHDLALFTNYRDIIEDVEDGLL